MIKLTRRILAARKRLFDTLGFFEGGRTELPRDVEEEIERRRLSYRTLNTASEIRVVARALSLGSSYEERIESGDTFVYLADGEGRIVSFGWATKREKFWVSEIGISLKSRGRVVLFDFFTPAEHQMRGYHRILLQTIFSCLSVGQRAVIFALKGNVAPWKVYRRIGLKRLSVLGMAIRGELSLKR